MDASDIIKRQRDRTNFAFYVRQRERQEQGCILHFNIESGSGSANAVSQLNSIRVGATQTTEQEELGYLVEGVCATTTQPEAEPPVPPSGLPSASLWFDPSDTNSITVVGGNITAFTDKTGNNNDGVALNGTAIAYNTNPINGLGTVRFTNNVVGQPVQCLKVTNSDFNDQYISYAFVLRYISGQKGFVATDRPGFYGRGIGAYDGTLQTISYNAFTSWDGTPSPSVTIPTGTPTIIIASISAGDWIVSVNGTQYTLPLIQAKTPDNNVGLNIGCWNPTNFNPNLFDMGELLVYTSFLSSSEIEKVEGYLGTKWGLLGNLPSEHPYKNGYP
jgi:hypothetical protein